MAFDRWAERIYAERDFGRSVATSGAGAVGLMLYLITHDWVIAAFSAVISFPIVRIAASAAHSAYKRKERSEICERSTREIFEKLSSDEKGVLYEFVICGGSVMSWSHANRVNLSEPGVASLMQRKVLYSTMTPDGMREAFCIDVDIFDEAQKAYAREADF
ncbi:MAG: super-infection exclusion protein B [Acidiferrobacteraceae bacterium]